MPEGMSRKTAEERNRARDEFAKAAIQGLLAGDSSEENFRYFNEHGKIKAGLLIDDAYDIANEAMRVKSEVQDDKEGDPLPESEEGEQETP